MYQQILLLNRLRIGDCIFTTPAIRALRQAYPEARFTVVVPRANLDLFAHSPHVDELLARPVRDWWSKIQFIRAIRRRRFDMVVSFQEKSIFYALTARFGGMTESLSLFNWRTRRFYRRTAPWPAGLHRVERYLTLAAAAGATANSSFTELYLAPADRERAAARLRHNGVREGELVIGLNAGSTEAERCWPPERFAVVGDRLAERTGARVLLLGGPRDAQRVGEIAAAMRQPTVNLAGRTRLLETAALLERCDLLISGDTGPLHMAAALGTPVVALFGPSDPRVAAPRFGAPGGRARILRKPYSCGRCVGPCLHTITAEECLAAAMEMLEEGADRDGRSWQTSEPAVSGTGASGTTGGGRRTGRSF